MFMFILYKYFQNIILKYGNLAFRGCFVHDRQLSPFPPLIYFLEKRATSSSRTGIRRTINMDAESDCVYTSAGSNLSGSGRPRSPLWNYFEYIESNDKRVCKIESCGVEVRGKFTTNLKRHLEQKHAECYCEVEKIEEEKKKTSNQSSSSSRTVKKNDAKQRSMDDFMKKMLTKSRAKNTEC